MITRGELSKEVPLNIVGSSTFGAYPKISAEKTYNMFISDEFLVVYPGYKSILENLGQNGRAIYTSNVSNNMIAVISNVVYAISIFYNPAISGNYEFNAAKVGFLSTYDSDVYIAENNAGQILISDGSFLYLYWPNGSPVFQQLGSAAGVNFIPGYVTFHDTRFIVAATQDATYTPPANNTWRLSQNTSGVITFPDTENYVGLLQTKPDKTVAVTRFPSRGNMIFVFGENVTEAWFDLGLQLFPYQRGTSFNCDYGCLNPATICAMDELVVWLAANERSGPVIMASDGGPPKKITTDGLDRFLSNLSDPSDAEAFMYRQDGHLFYHINFITDNFSLFYDFNTEKFFHACDQNSNYYIIKQMAFFNNQYYGISRNNGNVYAVDTIYTTYDGLEIPRIRVCKNVRFPTQDYFTVTDTGFTVEQGTTDPQQTLPGDLYPRVDMSISYDGGESFGQSFPYQLNPLGKRQNMLRWWQLGLANDWTPQFRFWGFGRFVATDGITNLKV